MFLAKPPSVHSFGTFQFMDLPCKTTSEKEEKNISFTVSVFHRENTLNLIMFFAVLRKRKAVVRSQTYMPVKKESFS